jgi:hypothetical protein
MTGFNSKRKASYTKLNYEFVVDNTVVKVGNLNEPMFKYKEDGYKVPLCFNSMLEWKDWQKAARVLNPGSSGYCTDCTFKYKNQMVKENRCSYPTVKFKLIEDGGVEGVREKLWFEKHNDVPNL